MEIHELLSWLGFIQKCYFLYKIRYDIIIEFDLLSNSTK